ncbi:MAG TPA: ABC transporter substrate binding protein [Vicinamibacterales bacterium]|nr:ABC transporter substrate binding protein [Vicinamibacterales bacterium]
MTVRFRAIAVERAPTRVRIFARGVMAPVIVAATVGCLSTAAAAESQTHAPRTVLAIHGGPEFFPGSETTDRAIRNVLLSSSSTTVNYFTEYLESEEFTLETASNALRESIRLKFAGRRIDVLIANTVVALEFTIRVRDELFPGVPIVFLATTVPDAVVRGTTAGVTGILRGVALRETVELALKLHPSVRQVFVIAYAPAVEGYTQRVQSTLDGFAQRVRLTYIGESSLAAMIGVVKALPPQSLVLYARYSPVDMERVEYPDELLRSIAKASSVPVYAGTDIYMGQGIVGGMMRTNEADGTRVGEITLRVLEGTRPEEIAIASPSLAPIFDWRQIHRWGIDPSRLPTGSLILFRTPTMWESYGWYIAGTIVVVIAQLLLITGLLTQRERRRRAERVVRAREASLRTSYDRIRLLAGRLINAQEAARASVAQDLHDDICQRLAMVSTAIDRLRNSSGRIGDVHTQRAFAALAHDTRGTFESVRRLSHDLHPATLRVLGLVPAIKTHCTEVTKRHNVQVTFASEGDLQHVPDDIAVCFFRIAQESLRNGVVHGAAHRFTVSLTRSGDDIEMIVTDNGKGFSLDAVNGDTSGVGVISMEDRARAVGGSLYIVSGADRGTTIRIRAPLKSAFPVDAPDRSHQSFEFGR